MFSKAQRKKAKLRLALCGPSGSGKTYSALLLAKGLGGKIAMIDTEHSSGELYADIADYDVQSLEPPYGPDRYIAMIHEAEQTGYSVLIVDSLSHAWTGEGGVLDLHDKAAAASRSGNSYTAWREVTPQHNALVDAILGAKLHVIVGMRTKTAYEIVEDDKGKKAPKKIGLAPVQREGMEYEFTVVLDLSVDSNLAAPSKDRTRLFTGKHIKLAESDGARLHDWLESGIDANAQRAQDRQKYLIAIAAAPDTDTLRQLFADAQNYCKDARDTALWAELKGEIETRHDALSAGSAAPKKGAKVDRDETYRDYESVNG